MYRSLKKWLNIPVKIRYWVSTDGASDITYSAPVDALCYKHGKTQVVTDSRGKEVVSNIQLYLDGSISIAAMDLIVFGTKEHSIKAIGPFYDTKGNLDLTVVYL